MIYRHEADRSCGAARRFLGIAGAAGGMRFAASTKVRRVAGCGLAALALPQG